MTAVERPFPNGSPTFRPWVGDAYSTGGVLGLRLFILGESHYGSGADEVLNPETTNLVIRNHIRNPTRERLFGTLEALLTGERLATKPEREAFWQSVVFSNLVQRLLPTRAHRPAAPDWPHARGVFVRLLKERQPDAVLVLGSETWNDGLSEAGFLPSHPVDARATPWLREWQVTDDHCALAMRVRHPTGSKGRHPFRLSDWRALVSEMLAQARMRVATRANA